MMRKNQSLKNRIEALLGDEAVALAAIHSGITGAYSYPGTPSTEILEFIQFYIKRHNYQIHAKWAANEKVAFENALGISYVGKRAMVAMKHVGLNVAADPLMSSAITGVNGGLLIAVADDPSMHSSQNEQDSRYYARFSYLFCFEPSNQQEAYDMTREAFELSERFEIPIILRLVTRLAHSRTDIDTHEGIEQNKLKVAPYPADWTLIPLNARRRFKVLLEKQKELKACSENSAFNEVVLAEGARKGVIVSGIAYNYFRDNLEELNQKLSYIKIATYPLPQEKIKQLVDSVDEILVIEEGYPFIEDSLHGLFGLKDKNIRGKRTGDLPLAGELTPDTVRAALGLAPRQPAAIHDTTELLKPRPPRLCVGCPHIDVFKAMNEVTKAYDSNDYVAFSDVGCYALGALPPFNTVHTCVEMGASIGMARGASDAGLKYSMAVIGDSTFAHSGLPALLGAAKDNINMTVFILDNATVAMTGGQETLATGNTLKEIVKGLGVQQEHIKTITPLPMQHEKNVELMRKEIEYKGLSVIISCRECIQTAKRRKK
jgi:indolepyruvate ferredoxin oxidoreductase alpha subunit